MLSALLRRVLRAGRALCLRRRAVVGAKEPARALYGASAYAAPRTPSPGRLRASPAAVATHHHLTPAGPSCLGWERPSDGRVRQTRVGSAFSGRFHTCYVRSCASAWRTRSGRASDPAWGGDGRGGRRRATARAAAHRLVHISVTAYARGQRAGALVPLALRARISRRGRSLQSRYRPCLIIIAIMLT